MRKFDIETISSITIGDENEITKLQNICESDLLMLQEVTIDYILYITLKEHPFSSASSSMTYMVPTSCVADSSQCLILSHL